MVKMFPPSVPPEPPSIPKRDSLSVLNSGLAGRALGLSNGKTVVADWAIDV